MRNGRVPVANYYKHCSFIKNFVAVVVVVVVMVTRFRSSVCRLPGSCDVSGTCTTLGDSLLLHADPSWNRFSG